jgi:hypothetical protein
MNDAPKKKRRTVDQHIDTGAKAAEVVKDLTDDKTDAKIDKTVQAAKFGGGIFSKFRSIFGR